LKPFSSSDPWNKLLYKMEYMQFAYFFYAVDNQMDKYNIDFKVDFSNGKNIKIIYPPELEGKLEQCALKCPKGSGVKIIVGQILDSNNYSVGGRMSVGTY